MNDSHIYQSIGNAASIPMGYGHALQQYVVLSEMVPSYCQPPMFAQHYQTNFNPQILPLIPPPPSLPDVQNIPNQNAFALNNKNQEVLHPRKKTPLLICDPRTKESIPLPAKDSKSNLAQSLESSRVNTPHPLIVSDPPRRSERIKADVSAFTLVNSVLADVNTTDNHIPEMSEPVKVEKSSEVSPPDHIDKLCNEINDAEPSEAVLNSGQCSSIGESNFQSDLSSELSVQSDNAESIFKYDRNKLLEIRKMSESSAYNFLTPSSLTLPYADRVHSNYRKERQRRCITLTTDIKIDSVDNAYMPAPLRRKEIKESEKSIEGSVNLILNRLLEDNVPEIVRDIKNLSIASPHDMNILVNTLINKATRQSKYSKVFAKLCVELSRSKFFGDFRSALICAVNKLFETPLQKLIDDVNAKIDAKIAETTDEKVKKMFEEDRDTAISKRKDSFLGIIRFFSELFVEKLIPDKSIADSLKNISRPKSQDEVLALLTCLNTCGPVMEHKLQAVLSECISGLEAARSDIRMEQYVAYKITALIELHDNHWVKHDQMPTQIQILQRPSESRRDNVRRLSQPPIPRKVEPRIQLNIQSLALGAQKGGYNEKFLGPRNDWTKGSSSTNQSFERSTQNRYGVLAQHADAKSESESGKDSGLSSTSRKKIHLLSKPDRKVNEFTISEVITDVVNVFRSSVSPSFDLLLPESDKCIFIEEILTKYIEENSECRKLIADILAHFYTTNQLRDNAVIDGFAKFLKFCNDDFIVDCPMADAYISEFLAAFINVKSKNLNLLVGILHNLPEDRRSSILANCLSILSRTLGEDSTSHIFQRSSIPWVHFQNTFFEDFATVHKIGFLLPKSSWGNDLSDIDRMFISSKHDLEALRSIFSEMNATNPQPLSNSCKFLSLCLSHCSPFNRKAIDSYVQILTSLSDHTPECEESILFSLQNGKLQSETFKNFLMSLLTFKVITKETLESFSRNPEAKDDYKKWAGEALRRH